MSAMTQRARAATTRRSGPISVRPWLRRLEDSLARLRRRDSREGAHQLRVACARVRVWLELAGQPALREALKQLRRLAAPLRNLDAQLMRGGPDALLELWAERRIRERASLLAAIRSHPPGPTLARIAALPPLPRAQARAATARLAARTLSLPAETDADLHRLRRAVRALRYALEWQGRGAGSLERFQAMLGAACDLQVSLELSRGHHQHAYRKRCKQSARDARHAARQAWRSARPSLVRLAGRRWRRRHGVRATA